jgi:hypothetical protein
VTPRHAAPVPADAPASVADVRVISGEPSPEELAAVIAVLQRQDDEAAAAGRGPAEASPRDGWDRSARGMREPLQRGSWGRSLR